jgi:hypothetical protein
VPDYVELVADIADAALAFYANPLRCVSNRCSDVGLRPFRRPRRDKGGPDARADIYLKSGLAGKGLTVSPRKGEGGSFVMIDPKLDSRPQRPRNGVHVILAHEMFHLVEFAYVHRGVPSWISEGVANAMAINAIEAWNIDWTDLAVQEQFEVWLKKPWLSFFSDEFDCARCYGNFIWWNYAWAQPNLLSYLYELMARSPGKIGLGVGMVDRAIRARGFLNERSLGDAMGVFWELAMRHTTPGKLAPLVATRVERTSGPANPREADPPEPGFLAGLSAHFVRFEVPGDAAAIRITLETDNGPKPRVSLFVGPGRTVNDTRVLRKIKPTRTIPATFMGRAGTATTVEAQFQGAAERTEVVLLVASSRTAGMRYRLRYASLSAVPPSRRYCGLTDQQLDFCFELASDGLSVFNFETELRVDQCNPVFAAVFPISIPTRIPINEGGGFSSTMDVTFGQDSSGSLAVRGFLDTTGNTRPAAGGTIQMIRISFNYANTRYECTGQPVRWEANP